jgi:hypothetical protein
MFSDNAQKGIFELTQKRRKGLRQKRRDKGGTLFRQPVVSPTCQFTKVLFCQLVICPTRYFAKLLFCKLAISPNCFFFAKLLISPSFLLST